MFYDDYETGKAFLHSHTCTGNALAASVAVATLDIIVEGNFCARANELGAQMLKHMKEITEETGVLTNVRSIGAMVAVDLVVKDSQE